MFRTCVVPYHLYCRLGVLNGKRHYLKQKVTCNLFLYRVEQEYETYKPHRSIIDKHQHMHFFIQHYISLECLFH